MLYLFIKRSGLSRYRRRGTVRRAERIQRERGDDATLLALASLPDGGLPIATLVLVPCSTHGADHPPQGA